MRNLLPCGQWLALDHSVWRAHRNMLLCNESGNPDAARSVLAGRGRPDSFTVAERLSCRPLWLAETERDGEAWLRALVARRVRALPQLAGGPASQAAAVKHVHTQMLRLLTFLDDTAEVLWNQEIPYVVDRMIACSLFGDPRIDPDPMPAVVDRSHDVADALMTWCHPRQHALDLATLVRYALTAGLLDLSIKGGAALCSPIDTDLSRPGQLGNALVAAARRPLAVDHLAPLLALVEHGQARLVWLTDDVIETAIDLLVIQRLALMNPRLHVVITPRSRRVDNDATHGDVTRMLRHRALHELAAIIETGRVLITQHGPGLAAPLPSKLHPTLLYELDQADAVMVKGGRNHELLMGTLARPLWTGYVITREFTQSQAGYDGCHGPLMLVHTPAGHRSWWGWRGRAHRTLAVAADRTISACWTTIADHERRATVTDPDQLAVDLAWLLDAWPQMRQNYPKPARAEIRHVADRLARHTRRLGDRDLIRLAHQITDQRGAPAP